MQRQTYILLTLFLGLISPIQLHAQEREQEQKKKEIKKEPVEFATPTTANHRSKTSPVQIKYRFQVTNNDHQTTATPTDVAIETTGMDFSVVKLGQSIDLTNRVSAIMEVNLTNQGLDQILEQFLLNFDVRKEIQFSLGKGKVFVGGYEQLNKDYEFQLISLYLQEHQPFQVYAPVLELHTRALGELKLQLTSDVVAAPTAPLGIPTAATPTAATATQRQPFPYFSKQQKQPAIAAQWVGKFGRITPLFQIASYDLHHSFYLNLGISFNFARIHATFDRMVDIRAEKYSKTTDGNPIELSHRYTNHSLHLSYDLGRKVYIPFLQISQLDIIQPTDEDYGLSDAQANTDANNWDDNQLAWQIGVKSQKWGQNFQPFIAMGQRSGEFYQTDSPQQTETRTDSIYYFGISGIY